MEKVSFQELTRGALQEKFDRAMKTVIANMQDPNTPWKNKRYITIRLAFEQTEDRDDAAVNISVETKTAPVKPISTRMAIGTDLRTGEVYAQEYGGQLRGQMEFRQEPGDPSQLVVAGNAEEKAEGNGETEKVVDFRTAREA